MRDNIILKCTVCGEEQYITSKIRKTIQIELRRKNIAHIVKKYKFSKKRNKLNFKIYD